DENFVHPHVDLNLQKHAVNALFEALTKYNLKKKDVLNAYANGFAALKEYQAGVISYGEEIIAAARAKNQSIIVIAGRPYHIDPEINHGIHKLMTSLNFAVITEDCIAHLGNTPKLDVLNQWTYHARLYKAAEYVTTQPDMQLVQLVSFGCGIDAITTDEVRSILEGNGKLYTQLKIDEINNLGAAKIRLRSLQAAIDEKKTAE
ncbi:MAG: acyl-CoA dehydratase activase-related protein, partial [Oscillospiraceae bacterium]